MDNLFLSNNPQLGTRGRPVIKDELYTDVDLSFILIGRGVMASRGHRSTWFNVSCAEQDYVRRVGAPRNKQFGLD